LDSSTDTLTFDDTENEFKYCAGKQALIAIETCTNKLNVQLRTIGAGDDDYRGALIYYEGLLRLNETFLKLYATLFVKFII
jgi:hypothetical protein